MNPFLEWEDEYGARRRLDVIDRVFIGRTCWGIDDRKKIILLNPHVSRKHAEIVHRGGALHITDTSINGTWVNGVRIKSGSSRELDDGDVIRIGDCSFKLVCAEPEAEAEPHDREIDSTRLMRRDIMVASLVADIRRFTEFSGTHSSSEVYSLTKEIFARFSGVVDECRGTVNYYAGDAVFATWEDLYSDPSAIARQACRAALRQKLALSEMLEALGDEIPGAEGLTMGWGITTGPATLAHYGSRGTDLAVVGDSVNLAFRFSNLAAGQLTETILICSKTAALVKEEFKVVDLGRVSVKGRPNLEPVFGLRP